MEHILASVNKRLETASDVIVTPNTHKLSDVLEALVEEGKDHYFSCSLTLKQITGTKKLPEGKTIEVTTVYLAYHQVVDFNIYTYYPKGNMGMAKTPDAVAPWVKKFGIVFPCTMELHYKKHQSTKEVKKSYILVSF